EDGIRVRNVTGVQTCALPISLLPKPFPILQEALDPLVRERMFRGRLQDLEGHRRDVCAGSGGLDNLTRAANTGCQDQRREMVLRSEERRVGKAGGCRRARVWC